MTNNVLPITINVCNAICCSLPRIEPSANKLEALLNFRTLQANWFGDEDLVPSIAFEVVLPSNMDEYANEHDDKPIERVSDDVFWWTRDNETRCYVELTDAECTLLSEKDALLSKFLEMKLIKVTNLIANHRALPQI